MPFADEEKARSFLGSDAVVGAWIADFQMALGGLRPRFGAVMLRTIEAVHEPRWEEWKALQVPTLAVFAKDGMFSDADKDELPPHRACAPRGRALGRRVDELPIPERVDGARSVDFE